MNARSIKNRHDCICNPHFHPIPPSLLIKQAKTHKKKSSYQLPPDGVVELSDYASWPPRVLTDPSIMPSQALSGYRMVRVCAYNIDYNIGRRCSCVRARTPRDNGRTSFRAGPFPQIKSSPCLASAKAERATGSGWPKSLVQWGGRPSFFCRLILGRDLSHPGSLTVAGEFMRPAERDSGSPERGGKLGLSSPCLTNTVRVYRNGDVVFWPPSLNTTARGRIVNRWALDNGLSAPVSRAKQLATSAEQDPLRC